MVNGPEGSAQARVIPAGTLEQIAATSLGRDIGVHEHPPGTSIALDPLTRKLMEDNPGHQLYLDSD